MFKIYSNDGLDFGANFKTRADAEEMLNEIADGWWEHELDFVQRIYKSGLGSTSGKHIKAMCIERVKDQYYIEEV